MPDAQTVQTLLTEVRSLIRQNQRAVEELQAEQADLQREYEGLELTLRRLGGTVHDPTEEGQEEQTIVQPGTELTISELRPVPNPWLRMNRAQAVTVALREIGRPADRNEIGRVLWQHGRDDDLNDISAALSYLKRQKDAERGADGKWALLALGAAAVAAVLLSGGGVSG